MFRRLSLAIAATLLAPSLAAHAHPPAQQSINRNFRSWSVVCDNTRRCIAESGGDDIDSRTSLIARLTRDAGPDAPASLELFATAPLDLRAARVDGRPLDMMPARWQALDSNANTPTYTFHIRTRDAATIDAWLAASRNAQTLSFGDPASASASTARLSLSGLSAALLLIDDTQGRVGTVTALLRKGSRPAAAVPAAPALPAAPRPAPAAARLSAADQRPLIDAVWAKFGGDVKRCAADMEDEMSPQDRRNASRATSLSADEALVSIPCQTSSLYNHTDLWYRVRRSPPYAPTPVDFGENANAGLDSASFVNELTQAGYDPADATLSSLVRLRSAGDCGSSASWIFDGRRFVLNDVAINGTCNGIFPDQWARLYRTAGATESGH